MGLNNPHLRYKYQTPRERTWTIHFIAFEKALKGIVLLVIALKMLTLFNHDVHAWAEDFINRHGIDLTNRYVHTALERLSGVGNKQLAAFSTIAVIYAALLFTESAGLWLQKRWAEYLTTFATALFIPIELYELYERFTWVRIAILALNIFVVWYLATRLRDEKKDILATESTAVRVKICGITNLEDAQQALEAGADELGFNFYPQSKRYISPEDARSIVDTLTGGNRNIGVFVNESHENVVKIAQFVGLDGIQLHGDEGDLYILELKEKTRCFVIKAFRVSPTFQVSDALDWDMDYPLFDAYSPKEFGGTGQAFDWENVAGDIFLSFPYQAYLAGGLTPENVSEAIRTVEMLYAVDVASGVESSPGKKDHEKVAAFIKAAKETI